MKKRNDFISIFFWYSLHQDTSKLDVINLKNKKGKGKREKCDIYLLLMFLIGEEEEKEASARKMTSLLINGAC